jgi:hypothetical protein
MLRDAASDLPEIVEGTSYGTPGFRVGKTLFARLWEDGETLVLKVDPFERDILLEAEPDIFFLTDHYRGHPWVLVGLAMVDGARLATLLRRAWSLAAPRRLLASDHVAADRVVNGRITPRDC